jgi:LacI family transcriptional regulator
MAQFISALELAQKAGLSRGHIPRMAEAGEIPGAQKTANNSQWFFDANSELEAWICFQRIRKQARARGAPQITKLFLRRLGQNWQGVLIIYNQLLSLSRANAENFSFDPEQDESTRWTMIERLLTTPGPLPSHLEKLILQCDTIASKSGLSQPRRSGKSAGSPKSKSIQSAEQPGRSGKKWQPALNQKQEAPPPSSSRLKKRIKKLDVALNINELTSYGRPIINGILAYLRKNPHWNIPLSKNRAFLTTNQLTKWKGDGIIGEFYNRTSVKKIALQGIPAINMAGFPSSASFPSVFSCSADNAAIGAMAAEHLINIRRPSFLYIGDQCEYSRIRHRAFENGVLQTGGTVAAYWFSENFKKGVSTNSYTYLNILKKHPEPISVFAATDRVALGLILACKKLKRRIPEDVAILGCDNEDIICQLSDPGISSIDWDPFRVGYKAAELLDHIMRGNPTRETIPPEPQIRLVLRGSTDVYVTIDKNVTLAMQFIRDHASDPIYVPDVVQACGISRRKLEALFRKHVRRGIHEEIRAAHMAIAEQLLINTKLSLAEISRQAGFNSVAALEGACKRNHGCYLGEFRQRNSLT